MEQSVLKDNNQSKNIRIGIWSSILSAITFSKIIAIFKAVGDVLPPVFILLVIRFRQYRLAGYFHLITLVLIIFIDMLVWGSFVPNASAKDVLMHIPFAIPMLIAAYFFLKPNSKTS